MAKILMFSFDFLLMLLLSLHVRRTNQMSFNFSNFTGAGSCSSGGNYVCLQGNVSVSDAGVIDLTNKTLDSVGRAVYSKPVRIWNNSTGKAANFTTEFSFKIARIPGEPYTNNVGDGLAFFLSPYPSTIPSASAGGQLGLLTAGGSVGQSFVAIEFDTFANDWDPPPSTSSAHVGIDINNIKSISTVNVNFTNEVGRAVIKYNAETLNLTVSVFYQGDPLLNGSTLLSSIVNISSYLPEEVAVGFTAATGSYKELHQITRWNFTSSPLEDINDQTKNNTSEVPARENGTNNNATVVGTTVGVGLLVVTSVCVVLGFLFFRKKSKATREGEGSDDEERRSIDDELEDGRGPNPRRFPYQTLVDATENFKSEAKIGEGGFGPVYKGFLSDLNLEVAIKRISRQSKQGKKEYVSEIKIISRLRHKNLVQLIGWCHKRSDLLLVYELMPNGSLDFHLFNQKSFLPWPLRYKIALDLASGLLYLHEEWEQCVVHRDIKSSNVMLDSSFNAKLGDFGLARLSQHGTGLQTTFVAGTMGYMAPECVITCKASKESDVYSFGVVALEIACGRRSIDQTTMDPDKERLVEWVWSTYGKGMLLEAIDRRFDEEGDVVDEDQAQRLMMVGLWCAHPDVNHRPTIRQAISVLNLERSTPILPSDMPLPTYGCSLSPFLDEEYLRRTTSLKNVPPNSNATNSSSSMPSTSITSSIKSLR